MRKILLIIILILIGTNILTFVFRGNNTQKAGENKPPAQDIDIEQPVASIDGEEIYYDDWMSYLENNYGEDGLREMINFRVVDELSDQKNLEVNQEVIDLEVALLATLSNRLTKEQAEIMEGNWREIVEHRLLTEMLLTEGVEVSESEMQTYYDTYEGQYEFSQRIELSHIVVNDQATADRVYQQLEDGVDFQSLAYEYTIDDDSRPVGGYLGFFTTDSTFLPAGYFDQVDNIEEHSYTEPFLGGQGYVILYLHRNLPEMNLDYSTVKDYVRLKVALEKLDETPSIQELWNELEVDWIY